MTEEKCVDLTLRAEELLSLFFLLKIIWPQPQAIPASGKEGGTDRIERELPLLLLRVLSSVLGVCRAGIQ
jgi:hypothetical protein